MYKNNNKVTYKLKLYLNVNYKINIMYVCKQRINIYN